MVGGRDCLFFAGFTPILVGSVLRIFLIFCVVIILFCLFIISLVCPMLPVSLDCPFLIAARFSLTVIYYLQSVLRLLWQFLWIVHFSFPLRFSLMFIYSFTHMLFIKWFSMLRKDEIHWQ